MPHPLLTIPWIEEYLEQWNKNETAMSGTKGLDGGLVELEVTDLGRPAVQFHFDIEGIGDYAGPVKKGVEPNFKLSATLETWRKVAHGEIGAKRAVTGPVKFQGSLLKAMKHFSGLEAALLQFGTVPTEEWS
ncbi:MAG TPA: SCP2 sterol-binding domain-containing protein [Solirubrobacteraceae bacterium]|jgi:putative sterol carrier protein|nr:SCP2 sterol-binding domain-containing protein [Solirubrobacteraceae bacterium]